MIFNKYLSILTFWSAGSLPLPWSIRMKIALGAAKGLAFLHEEAERPVIYRDFKTSNILLDAVSSPHFVNCILLITLGLICVSTLIHLPDWKKKILTGIQRQTV